MTQAPRIKVNEEGIPQELKKVPQWVLYKITKVKGRDTKKPYRATCKKSNPNRQGDEFASSTDPDTWSTYEEVIKDYKTGRFAGIGFVLANGYIGMDWDHIHDIESDEWDSKALQEIHSMGSYGELSQSGTGVHVIGRGNVPGEKGINKPDGEMYDQGRFFVVTGQHLKETSTEINDVSKEAIQAMYDRLNPSKNHTSYVNIPRTKTELTDEKVLALCMSATNADKFEALWNGDLTDYRDDQSAADLALCNIFAFYTQDCVQIDRIFRQSALYREKWDAKRGQNTYGEITIKTAIEGVTYIYTPSKEENGEDGQAEGNGHTTSQQDLVDSYPEHILKLAHIILENGDPLSFYVETWSKQHVGDEIIGKSCACAVAATFLTNTRGLHVKPSGDSGKGKSDGTENYLKLVPDHKKMVGSLSGKAAFYHPNMKKGTIIYSDDVKFDENITATIKQSTSDYQKKTAHNTVVKQKFKSLDIPPRVSWWLTSVDGFDDEQMSNRFLGMDVDASNVQDKLVFNKQVENELYGSTQGVLDTDILLCRAMYDILGLDEYEIKVPFAECIEWSNKENRRNSPMFLDIVKSVTFYKIKQREKFHGAYLATMEDFYKAKNIYQGLAETNATNLTEKELKVVKYMDSKKGTEVERKDIGKLLNVSLTSVKNLMHGQYNNGGLLNKVPGLYFEEAIVKVGETKSTKKYLYSFDVGLGFDAYTDVVGIREDEVEDAIRKFKEEFEDIQKEKERIIANDIDAITITPLQPHYNLTTTEDNNTKTSTIDRIINNILKNKENDTSVCGESVL